MTSYTVVDVGSDPEGFTTEHGSFKAYKLKVRDAAGDYAEVTLNQKDSTKPPELNEEIDGEIKGGPKGPRLKRSWSPGASQGGSNGSGGGYRPEDPRRAATILRQHSQHMALLHIEGMERRADPSKPFRMETLDTLTKIVDWFDADAKRAGDAA